MKGRAAAAALLLLVGACSTMPTAPAPQFRGFYSLGFERTTFIPCDRGAPMAWAVGPGLETVRRYWAELDPAFADLGAYWATGAVEGPPVVYIEADGELLGEGDGPLAGYGHLRQYRHQLHVQDVRRVLPRERAPADCGPTRAAVIAAAHVVEQPETIRPHGSYPFIPQPPAGTPYVAGVCEIAGTVAAGVAPRVLVDHGQGWQEIEQQGDVVCAYWPVPGADKYPADVILAHPATGEVLQRRRINPPGLRRAA